MAKKIANVCGIFVAIVLSVLLLLMLMIAPIVSGVTTLSQEKTLHKLVESVDLKELIPTESISVEEGNETHPMFEFMETEFFRDFANLYVRDLLAALEGEKPNNLTLDALNGLKMEHREELTAIMHNMLLTADGVSEEMLSDEMVQEKLDEVYNEIVPALVEELPTLEELGVGQEILDGIALLKDKTIKMVFVVTIIVLSLLILVFRWPRFKGFVWLGVVYLLSCPVLLFAKGFLNEVAPVVLAEEEFADLSGVLEPILPVLKSSMTIGVVVYVVLAVLFIAIAIFGRKKLNKKDDFVM